MWVRDGSGWLHTGDIGCIDHADYPYIADVAVLASPDEEAGEVLKA